MEVCLENLYPDDDALVIPLITRGLLVGVRYRAEHGAEDAVHAITGIVGDFLSEVEGAEILED